MTAIRPQQNSQFLSSAFYVPVILHADCELIHLIIPGLCELDAIIIPLSQSKSRQRTCMILAKDHTVSKL